MMQVKTIIVPEENRELKILRTNYPTKPCCNIYKYISGKEQGWGGC